MCISSIQEGVNIIRPFLNINKSSIAENNIVRKSGEDNLKLNSLSEPEFINQMKGGTNVDIGRFISEMKESSLINSLITGDQIIKKIVEEGYYKSNYIYVNIYGNVCWRKY